MAQRAIIRIEQGMIILEMEYNRKAVEALKVLIPAELREYNTNYNQWLIDISMRDEVESILEQFYPLINRGDVRQWDIQKER